MELEELLISMGLYMKDSLKMGSNKVMEDFFNIMITIILECLKMVWEMVMVKNFIMMVEL